MPRLGDEHIDDRLLEARGQGSPARPGRRRRPLGYADAVQCIQHRRVEAAEAEVEPRAAWKRAWECVCPRIAVSRFTLDRRAARKAQAEQGGHLVERLAGGIVDGRAEQLEVQR